MAADRSALLDRGRFLTASALLGLDGREGRLAPALARALARSPASRVAAGAGTADAVQLGIAEALRRAALGRGSQPQRAWAERIEARRTALAGENEVTEPVFSEGAQPQGRRWSNFRRPLPLAEACAVISVPPRWGLLLMHLIERLRPTVCLELGTGFGISAAYQAAALRLNGSGSLTTFEGAESWAEKAREGARGLGLDLEIRVGALSETLPEALGALAAVDLAFVDAEHTKEATVRYFETLAPHFSPGAVVLFDDIDFDAPMWEAWTEIRESTRVAAWASLGRMGLVRVS